MQSELTVDSLAQEIRRVDGNHSLGAGALAEALIPFLTAALSDKQAAEVSCIACEGRPSAGNNPCAVCGRSALVDVPAVEPEFWTSHNNLENLTMFGKGVSLDANANVWDFARQKWVSADTPLYTSPPLSREGEDSAEVVTLTRAEADRIAQRLEFDASWDKCGDGYYSIKRQLGILAATRSGSATDHSGAVNDQGSNGETLEKVCKNDPENVPKNENIEDGGTA